VRRWCEGIGPCGCGNAALEEEVMDRLMRKKEVLAAIGMKATWLHAEIKAGRFPKPVKIGARAIAWRRSDIEKWLNARTYVLVSNWKDDR
jgi:prophage regulatory protein